MLRRVWVVAAIVGCGVAWALPPLEPYRGHGFELQVPRGWTVTVDEAAGTLFVTEDPSDPTSAGLALLVVPHQPGLDATYLTDAIVGQVAPVRTELGRQEADGVVWTLQSFTTNGVSALLTSVAISREAGEVASIALFSARPEAFETLGGAALLFVAFGGADPAWFADAASTGAAAGGFPPLEPIAELGGAYLMPAGWNVVTERSADQELIYLQEDLDDDHSPVILFLAQETPGLPPAGTDVVAGVVDSFTSSFGVEDLTELRRSGDGLTGARLLSGTRLGRATTAFFAVFTDATGARIYGVVAPTERYDAFGGHGLMWITLGGMTVEEFEANEAMQAWYRPAGLADDGSGQGATAGSLAAQQMYLDMQSRMFMAWSNNLGGSTHCWGDSSGCY